MGVRSAVALAVTGLALFLVGFHMLLGLAATLVVAGVLAVLVALFAPDAETVAQRRDNERKRREHGEQVRRGRPRIEDQ